MCRASQVFVRSAPFFAEETQVTRLLREKRMLKRQLKTDCARTHGASWSILLCSLRALQVSWAMGHWP